MPRTCDLVRELLPDLRRWARRLGRTLPAALEPEDLVQVASIAVVHAVASFDATRGDDVRAHCRIRAWRAMLDAKRALRSVAANEVAGDHDEPADAEAPEGADLGARRWLNARIARLPGRLRRVIELRYGADLDVREIGDLLGLSPARISQLHGEAMALLRADGTDGDEVRS